MLRVASQQLGDRALVEKILLATSGPEAMSRRDIRVLVEQDYLFERSDPLPAAEAWDVGGKFENNRQALMALLRSNIELRTDFSRSARQHVNFITSKTTTTGARRVLLTSANFSPGSLGRHLNWTVTMSSDELANILDEAFHAVWERGLEGVSFDVAVPITPTSEETPATDPNGEVRLVGGSDGEALDALVDLVGTARERVQFALFNVSTSAAAAVEELKAAVSRGVEATGVVDGDQSNQPWDAVPLLQGGGVGALYYPGALTGARGRMHHKVVVVDGTRCYLGTANVSAAARRSLELALVVRDQALARSLAAEVARLETQGRRQPLRPIGR